MLKVVKRPKEYIAIKVPEVCEDVGKIVSEEAEKAGIRLDITTYYADGRRWSIKAGVKNDEAQTVKRGSIIVCKISQDGSKYPEAVDVMGQEEFDKKFKQVDDPVNVPHVRIEFDDINDVPHVWIDGKRIDRSDTALVSVSLDWHTKDPAATDHVIRAYKIEYLKGNHREGIAQGSPMGPDLFKNDIHAK